MTSLIAGCKVWTPAFLSLTLFCLSFGSLEAQRTLNLSPNSNIDLSADCINIEIGEMITFIRNSDCGPNTEIRKGLDDNAELIFSSEKMSSSYTFEEEGDYLILCNGAPSSSQRSLFKSASIAICLNLSDTSGLTSHGVPTMGEWALTCCALLLMICGVTSVKQRTILEIT